MAIGIAWLEYMAYVQFHDPKYLAAADTCMTQMDSRTANPFYETLGFFGPPLAARMNAELGRNYSTGKHLNWIFSSQLRCPARLGLRERTLGQLRRLRSAWAAPPTPAATPSR